MAPLPVSSSRFDPYKNFKFRLKWDSAYVAGVSRVSAFIRRTEVLEWREGGDPSSPHKSPGVSTYEALTLERGVTQDPAFEQWANKVWLLGGGLGGEVSLADFRKDITLELYNEAGQLVMRYFIYRCWVSEFRALPDLDSNCPQVAIQKLVLQNEGWERDLLVAAPTPPSISVRAKKK